jgi:hypothetical protein
MYAQTQYRTDAPQTPMVQIDVNRPPVAFDIRCAPWIHQYLPWLTGIMIDIITRNAQGPVSMHFYNNMSKNSWANNEFGQEVANCADFVFLKAQGQQNPDLIARLAPTYVKLRTDFEVALFPALRSYIAPQDIYTFDQAAQMFDGEIKAIVNLRNGVSQNMAPAPAPMAGGYPPPVQYAPPGAPMPAQQGYQTPGYGAPVGQPRNSGTGRDYGTGGQPPAPIQPPAPVAPPQQMRPMPPSAPVPPAAPQAAQQPQGSVSLVDPEDTKWNPDSGTPHPMLYNPVRVKMMYAIVDGKTKPQPAKTNMDPINYDRHNIATLFNKPLEGQKVVTDNAEIIHQIKDGARDAAEEARNVDEEGQRQEEAMGLRNVLSAYNLDSAITDLRTEMLAKIDRKNPPMVFQTYAQIFTPIIGEKSEYDLIHKLGDSSSYIELREKIRAAAATASPALLTDITLKLTKLMNDILTDRLSILPVSQDPVNGIEVDDFVADLDALLDVLKKRGADDRLYRAFINGQGARIKAMFSAPVITDEAGRELHDSLTSGMLTESWEGREDLPQFTFYGPTVGITFLNVVSHDLLIDGMLGVSNVVTKQHSAVLYDLVASLFDPDINDQGADRKLIVTVDGRILEVFEGTLIPETYLLKLVK